MKEDHYKKINNHLKQLQYNFKNAFYATERITFTKTCQDLLRTMEYKRPDYRIELKANVKATPYNLFKYHDLNIKAMELIKDIKDTNFRKEWENLLECHKMHYRKLAYQMKHKTQI
ncbi:hypothetical protein H311_00584 [Anncaliia algerae PRA109]|nr:hypothetical protein H311_00584 [Anncaliia algerae PRA109]